MRSRKSMLMVLTVLFVFVTTLIPMSAVADVTVVEYVDVTPNSDGAWINNVAEGLAFGEIAVDSAAGNVTTSAVTDPLTGALSMQYDIPAQGTIKNYKIGAGSYSEIGLDNKTTWYVLDIYYEDAVIATSLLGNAQWGLFTINADGSVGGIGHYSFSSKPAGYIKPNTNYHIEVAVDSVEMPYGSESRFYAWINGDTVADGSTMRTHASETSSISYVGMQFQTAGPAKFCVSNYKFYTTDSVASGHNPFGYAAGATITSDAVKVAGNQIKVVEGTTVAALDALIEDTLFVTYWDGETKVAADSTASAIGKTVKVSDGKAIKDYVVILDTGITEYVNASLVGGVLTNSVTGTSFNSDATVTAATNPYTGAAETLLTTSASGGWKDNKVTIADLSVAGKTLWYELDLRFANSIIDTQIKGLAYNTNLLCIDGNGGKASFPHQDLKTAVPAGTFASNKYYKIMIALDYTATNYPVYTLWVNGEPIVVNSSNPGWSLSDGSIFNISMYPGAIIGLSGAKVYTTDYSVADAISTGKNDPTAFGKAAEIKSSAVTVSGNDILVPVGTTLADLADKIDAGLTVNYLDANNSFITDMTTAAIGTTVATGKDGEVKYYTVKKLVPTRYDERVKVDNWYDVNFNNSTWNNAAGTARWSRAAGTYTETFVEDAAKGNGVVKYTIANTSAMVLRDAAVSYSNLDTNGKTIWYEFAIKFEGHVSAFDIRTGLCPVAIDKNGMLYLGSLAENNGTYGSMMPSGITLTTDKWYHIVIATDFVDKVEVSDTLSVAKLYAWVNGELVHYGANDWTLTWNSGSNANKLSAGRLDMYIGATAANDVIYFDDVKMFSTSTPVRKADGSLYFDPTYDFAKFTVDGAKVIGDKIYTDSAVTAEDFEFTMGSLVSVDGNNVIVKGEEGVGFSYYTVAAPVGYAVESAFTRMNSMSDVTIVNTTDDDKTAVVALATYGANGLVDFEIVADAIAIDAGSEAWVRLPALSTANATTARVFVWDSFETLKPAFASYDVALN